MAYHGRASTVKVSGTPVTRPHGVRMGQDGQLEFGPSRQLDYEVELGCVVGGQNELGQPTPASAAGERIFGFVLLNDWSARDIQRYEYVPFGPFAGKSFLTSISPWVVSIDALAPWRVHGPTQEPRPLDYLTTDEPWNLNIDLTTRLRTPDQSAALEKGTFVAQANAASLYWNCAQWLAQVTVSGGIASPGDLLGSGTISGWNADEKGCLAERTANGRTPVALSDSVVRSMLEDGDTIEITGICNSNDAAPYRIGFGSVRGTVVPAEPPPS
jgi:fumarylacetoacetase